MIPPTTDSLVIGGGVIGLSLAYELSGRGQHTTLIDRQAVGQEASWAGAGMLPPGSWYSGHEVLEELATLSGELNPRWSAELLASTGIDNEFGCCGGVYLASSDDEWATLSAIFARWAERGTKVEPIDAARLVELEPSLGEFPQRLAQVRGGYHLPEEGQLRNPRHMAALRRGCESRGVQIAGPCQIVTAISEGSTINQVVTDQGTIACRQVLLAAGAWSSELADLWGFRLGVRPIRGQMILTPPRSPSLLRGNVHVDGLYAVPRRDGRILIGATVEDVGFDKSTTNAATRSLELWAKRVCPALADAPIERAWAGLRPASHDGLPYIGRAPRYSNLWVATGHYRAGLQLAAATAVVLADHVTGQPSPVDLHPFRIDR